MCKTLTITPKLTFMSLKFELNDLTVSASLLQLASVNTLSSFAFEMEIVIDRGLSGAFMIPPKQF